MANRQWLDNVKLPGKGIRLMKEVQREALYAALIIFFKGVSDPAKTSNKKYLDWTGYLPRSSWELCTNVVDQDLLETALAMVQVVNDMEIEIKTLRIEVKSDVKERKDWDFITDD